MTFTDKKIGIWGLGISGTATYNYLKNKTNSLQILNQVPVDGMSVILDTPENRKLFLQSNDIIIPSPGINLCNYTQYAHKFVPEVDIFQAHFKNPIIGITGTLGKTSITHYLTTLLNNAGITAHSGGNIGTGILDLLSETSGYALLELSSFQLERAETFAPDLAIWTNFHPNHLDRHGTKKAYFEAKKRLILNQKNNQRALIPFELAEELRKNQNLQKPYSFFSITKPNIAKLLPTDTIYYFDSIGNIIKNEKTIVLYHSHVPTTPFKINWLIIAATIDLLGYQAEKIIVNTEQIKLPSSRLEFIATINETDYYNDSKSTLMQATLAAIESLKNRPIILLLGGISKGVDRTPYIAQLKDKVERIICFGTESNRLAQICNNNGIPNETHKTLETAFISAYKKTLPGKIVILSPGGASFDLFQNYHERGETFKKLLLNLQQQA